jgi:hypothetical protein
MSVKFSQIASGVSSPFVPATDQILAVRSGTTDVLLNGVAAGPGTSVAHNLASFGGTDGVTLEDSGILKTNVVTLAGSQTLTNKTLTGNISADIARCTTQLDKATSTALSNIVGLVQTVVVGTYHFRINIQGTAGASGGMKLGFKLTTTVLSACNAGYQAFAAAAVASGNAASLTADQATLMGSTSAVNNAVIEGTFVVSTGGTMQLQMAQNASDGTTCSVYVGSTMEFNRIA